MLRLAAAAVAVAAIAVGFGSSGSIGTGTVACSTSGFSISFDPAHRVVVTSGDNKVLASASFTAASLGSQCKRVAEPTGYVNGGLGAEIRKAIAFRCLAGAPIRIHVNPITNEAGKIVGSNLGVGIGAPRLRVIVSAVLKNRGDPYVSRVYRSRSYCKLGAKS